jgi:hypothetical protein
MNPKLRRLIELYCGVDLWRAQPDWGQEQDDTWAAEVEALWCAVESHEQIFAELCLMVVDRERLRAGQGMDPVRAEYHLSSPGAMDQAIEALWQALVAEIKGEVGV